jgi:parallel beta-helix repeat protein
LKKVLGLPVFAAIIILMIIPLSPLPIANAAKITVPTDFPTIQDAIDAATDGDTINVLKGTYIEQVSVDKDLKIVGAGAKTTIIKAPQILSNNTAGHPFIVDINSGAKTNVKGFTINGPDSESCPRLVGVSVLDDSTLNLDSSIIKECVVTGLSVDPGHATITNTDIINYRSIGIFTFGDSSTLKFSNGKVIADPAPETVGPTGIEVLIGAKGTILNSKISGNICINPECGPDFFTQTQGAGILYFEAAAGSAISNNEISDNDIGIAVGGTSECCKIDHNKLKNNPFFGITIFDGEQTSTHDKISGGDIGVAAIATFVDTTATLVHDKITGATTPTQELECCGSTAEIVTIPPNSFQISQLKSSSQASEVDPDFIKKKFGVEEDTTSSGTSSSAAVSPF